MRRTIEIVAFVAALAVAAMAIHAWLSSRADEQRLQSTLSTQKQVLDAADARERARDSTLADMLAQIDQLKRATKTPAQIVRALPNFLPLPQPITLSSPAPPQKTAQQGSAESGTPAPSPQPALPSPITSTLANTGSASQNAPPSPAAELPVADLKPLFDFVQDCRACQAQLAAAQQNATDNSAKVAALTKERDAAVTAAKGGTFLRRLRRNALWFVVGAAAGYAARR